MKQDLLKKITETGEIKISPSLWSELNEKHSKDDIKHLISDAMSLAPLPYRKITEEVAEEDFNKLKTMTENDVVKQTEWFTRYDYECLNNINVVSEVFGCNNTGNKSSDFFQQENRWLCDSINAPSPYRTWTIEKFRLTLLNALWTLKVEEVTPAVLRSCIGLRKYIAAQFRASAAKVVYDQFSGGRVLDLSSGWGDRLAGFAASSADEYVGIDPNPRVHVGYKEQIDFYERLNGSPVNAKMIQGCAEDVDLSSHGKFDLVFTSPPYYNIERYNTDESQSYKRYRKCDDWLNGFLFKALDNGWSVLNSGGVMMINISDVYSNHTINKLCDPMGAHMLKKSDIDGMTVLGYEMRKRPNSGAIKGKTGVFCEPIWCFWKR